MIIFSFVVFLFATIFLLVLYRWVFYQIIKQAFNAKLSHFPPVSIVVAARNEAKNLPRLVETIAQQQYPIFELLIVDDASTDESREILTDLQKKHTYLSVVVLEEKKGKGKKEALAFGIQQSKYDYLLLTDADCLPNSPYWITGMLNAPNQFNTGVVLGLGYYEKQKGWLNKIIQWDTLFIAYQYLSFALLGKPYMSVGRNVAYKKELFNLVNGFAKHEHIQSGDDDLFIQDIYGKTNVGVQISYQASTISIAPKTFKAWMHQKSRHISTGVYYKKQFLVYLALIQLNIFLFYLMPFAILFLDSTYWIYLITIILIKFLVQYQIFNTIQKRLKHNEFSIAFLVFEILWVFLNGIQVCYKLILRNNRW